MGGTEFVLVLVGHDTTGAAPAQPVARSRESWSDGNVRWVPGSGILVVGSWLLVRISAFPPSPCGLPAFAFGYGVAGRFPPFPRSFSLEFVERGPFGFAVGL